MFFNDHDGKPVDPGREALKGWCRNNPKEAFEASILGTRIAIAILVIGGLDLVPGFEQAFRVLIFAMGDPLVSKPRTIITTVGDPAGRLLRV